MCNEQPLPLTNLPSLPVSRYNAFIKGIEPTDLFRNEFPRPSNVSDRPPSLKPLDLGDSSLFNRWPYHNKQRTPSGHNTRPSISTPYNFRRLDHTDAQRQSLVPLRLGPVVLRESPIPDTDIPGRVHLRSQSDSTQHLLNEATSPESYRLSRDTPFQRCQQRSSSMWPLAPQRINMEMEDVAQSTNERLPARPRMVPRSRSASSLGRQGTERSSSSISSRPSSERLRPKRKRSFQSLRKGLADDDEDIENEIMELNTIVEERRAEAAREGASEEHIAAVAPSMQIHARSETLDAIGSALSRPATARDRHMPAGSVDKSAEWFVRRSISSKNRASNRVSGWLSGLLPSVSTQVPTGEPFYKCQPPPRPARAYSDSSIRTALTDMDSPSLTAASSPTSRGHSRSHTGESRMTPITPAGMGGHADFDDHKTVYDRWPIAMTPTSQVGLAI